MSIFALAAGFLLFVISILLAGLGWSRVVSEEALQGSLLVFLLVVSLAINLRGIHSNQESATLSILAGPIVLPNDDVRSVVDEIDRNGRADKTEITYDLGDLDSGFAWFFRKQAGWKGTAVSPQADLALSVNEAEFSAVDAYRGRNVVLSRSLDRRLSNRRFLGIAAREPLPLVLTTGRLMDAICLFIEQLSMCQPDLHKLPRNIAIDGRGIGNHDRDAGMNKIVTCASTRHHNTARAFQALLKSDIADKEAVERLAERIEINIRPASGKDGRSSM